MVLLVMFAALLTATAAVANDTLPSPRIVGGFPATAGEFPFLVHGADGELCGGTLIAPDIVLTAAHCTGAFGSFVIIGAIDVYGRDRTPRINVESLNPHPDYVPGVSIEARSLLVLDPILWLLCQTQHNIFF